METLLEIFNALVLKGFTENRLSLSWFENGNPVYEFQNGLRVKVGKS
jgi:hypothetical protein